MKKIVPNDCVLVPDQAQKVFSGMIFDVYQWQQTMFDGSGHTFEMLKRTDTVSIIGLVDGKAVVIDDEQPHLGSRKSFPGGRVDAEDADALSAAKREMQEETGYTFNNWRLIKVSQPYRKIEWFVSLFLAWDVAGQQAVQLDAGEKIKAELLDFDTLKELVMSNQEYYRYLGENQDLFAKLASFDDLLAVPEFAGREVDR
jgi:8-oxo-dGTP pyrophosphatase MutT (NUDIX family)